MMARGLTAEEAAREASRLDPSTQSNYGAVSASHVDLAWTVDFEAQVIRGSATYRVTRHDKNATAFVVDTSSGLAISRATVDGAEASVAMGAPHEIFGTAAAIPLPADGATMTVRLDYATAPTCSAAQWLDAAQTAEKRRPYLFTQCQAIHARALLPCQDTPGMKLTWTAAVTAPTWATVLMSGLEDPTRVKRTAGGATTSFFTQPIATSTYLVAIVCAALESRDISPRCRVWSEASVVAAAAEEFSQTEQFLQAAEAITGLPYPWGRYDLVCLAPSFPYGGMENPCLTFVTPTLLAGDKSLAGVVAHEIAHSWTGNLVTNATWSHFWLNEGWTRWLERKIKARVEAEEDEDLFEAMVDFDLGASLVELRKNVDRFEAIGQQALTALNPPIEGIDPDDAFSLVPYEKGSALLHCLEHVVSKAAFAGFVQRYIREHANATVTTKGFRDFAVACLPALAEFDWATWLHAPGMPPKLTWALDETIAKKCLLVADAWATATPSHDQKRTRGRADHQIMEEWTADEVEALLNHLIAKKPPRAALDQLDAAHQLSASRNAEVRSRWCHLLLAAGAPEGPPLALDFVTTQGRMKFVRPLYRAVAESGIPNARTQAVETFLQNADFYHPICRKMVAADLGLLNKPAPHQRRTQPLLVHLASVLAGAAILYVGLVKLRRK